MSDVLNKEQVQFIDRRRLDALSQQAALSPRLRQNYNFHRADQEACHRLLNAMEPGSYIQPHCHRDEGKEETLLVVRGRMGLVLFDEDGQVEGKALFEPAGDPLLVHIPRGTFHTWLSLQRGSVFFEAKAGPYRPLTKEEKAPWAPAEGDPAVPEYLASLLKLFPPGDPEGRKALP
ncbi:MAG: WbuC family cupin fold metalloprotein [Deltaproteobacteria bacterium]|nr:WbuC family cupin fold metalloprotein [Deltaproteobacteria bacterium]